MWVEPDRIGLRSRSVGALPVVNAVLARLGFDELVASYLPEPDGRCELAVARVIGCWSATWRFDDGPSTGWVRGRPATTRPFSAWTPARPPR